MPTLYIIGGCNGAGKTTASKVLLPEILKCKEFVNADAIASGISPFAPEKVAFQAARIMLDRIQQLIKTNTTFAIETTLSTLSYHKLIHKCKSEGYNVVLIFFWLHSVELAIKRVADRVSKGGHNIETTVVRRRYKKGLKNLKHIFLPIADVAFIFNNSELKPELIAEYAQGRFRVINKESFNVLQKQLG